VYIFFSLVVAVEQRWIFMGLALFWLILQHVEDIFNEPGEVHCVYVVFHYLGEGEVLECCWSLF
jgi:hypothetical protein